jgi:CBS domain-containing protein
MVGRRRTTDGGSDGAPITRTPTRSTIEAFNRRRFEMRVKDVMTTDVVTVRPDTPLKDVARLLAEHGISGVPVVDDDGLVLGVVSEADVLYKERGEPPHRSILVWLLRHEKNGALKFAAHAAAEAMTAPAHTIQSYRLVSTAAQQMLEQKVNRLPVVENGKLLGIVTRADLVRAFVRSDAEIERDIRAGVDPILLAGCRNLVISVDSGDVRLTGEAATNLDAQILEQAAARAPGVVNVESRLTWRGEVSTRV